VKRRGRAALVATAGIVAALIAYAIDRNSTANDLALLAAGVVLGELFVLRLEDRSSVPLSFAVMIVLASSFALDEFACTVIAAEIVAFFLCSRGNEPRGRWEILVARILVAAATVAAYRGMMIAFDHSDGRTAVLVALATAALAQFVTEMTLRTIVKRGSSLTTRGRLAWLAVASSGMLMAIGYSGVNHKFELGIWGAMLFALPLAAAWYAFERLDSATLAYRQTIESLAMAPELGGLVPAGHAERVAALVGSMGNRLGLPAADLDDLEMAALLHHVGQVTLDDPEVAGRPEPHHVAAVTSSMLREIQPLAGAGDIVAGDVGDDRRRLAVQVLRLASEYDDLTVVNGAPPTVALETLRTAPRYVYDERVLSALERSLGDTTNTVG
jgi:hypothetical protein